jgi:hypothetical protein
MKALGTLAAVIIALQGEACVGRSEVVYQPGCKVTSAFDEWCTCGKNKDGKLYEDCAQ